MEARTQGAQEVSKGKAMFALAIGMLAFVAGLYLSGYLALLLLQARYRLLKWNTTWTTGRRSTCPQVQPSCRQDQVAGYLGFGVPLLRGWRRWS